MKNLVKSLLQFLLRPVAERADLERWPGWMGRVFEIKIPGKVIPNRMPTEAGSANINIVLALAERTMNLAGNIAECGVYRGATLAPLAHYLGKQGSSKMIYGFDSFSGFDDSVHRDMKLGSAEFIEKEGVLFTKTTEGLVKHKIRMTKAADRVQLVKGYFKESLQAFSGESFCFVHLDCDLYESYRTCLSFFYPRMCTSGIILFDEYNDPVYKGCNVAVDEFLADKPEKPIQIQRDNYIKYYIQKQ